MANLLHSPSRFYLISTGKKTKSSSSKIFARFSSGDDDDTVFKAAVNAASIRFQESLRPGVGAKISKGRVLLHVPMESSDLQSTLEKKGFSGNMPSFWVLQGLPLMTLKSFEDILSNVSSSAMEGCIFMGELPGLLLETKLGNTFAKREMLEKVFMNHGFQVDVIEYVEVARKLHLDPPPGDHEGIIFIARQFSKPSLAMNQQFEVLFLRILDEPAFIYR